MLILILIGTLMFAYSNPYIITNSPTITSDNPADLCEIQYPVIENVTINIPADDFGDAPVTWHGETATLNLTGWVRIPNFDDFLNNRYILNFTEAIWQELVNITLHEEWTNNTMKGIEAENNPSDAPITVIPVNKSESGVVKVESATAYNTPENGDLESQVKVVVAEFPLVNTSLMFVLAILTAMVMLAKMGKQKLALPC